MLITSEYVMLNFPRTGSSFTRKMLKLLYATRPEGSLREELLPNLRVAGASHLLDHHGMYSQIPVSDAQKPVFTIARDPFHRLLSLFHYRFWVQSSPIPCHLITRLFPRYPDLNLNDYIKLETIAIPYRLGFQLGSTLIGAQSVQFIQMFFKNPRLILAQLTDSYIDSDAIFEDVGPIEFLRNEYLRSDLKEFLGRFGFSSAEVALIDKAPDSNASLKTISDDLCQLNSSLQEQVKRRERLMYRIYERAGISYQ
jgi:hypothetical protein